MLYASRHDEELALPEGDGSVPKLERQLAVEHEKHLVLVLVVVPDELPLELRQLHVLSVELAHDARAPVLRDALQRGGQIDFLHRALRFRVRVTRSRESGDAVADGAPMRETRE
jgi:hypothetical protein